MPGCDGTGPNGMGPMTGRAAGYCVGVVPPRTMGRGMRRGAGRGVGGRGMGRRNQGRAFGPGAAQWGGTGFPDVSAPPEPLSREEQLSVLTEQAAHVEGALADIRARIDALTPDPEDK